MSAEQIAAAVDRIAAEIVAAHAGRGPVGLLGVLRRGKPLADRLAGVIGETTGEVPPVGALATTLYRDDLHTGKPHPSFQTRETHFDFDVDGMDVVLVDDVLFSGRTARAALDEVMDYGRPNRIQLACLVDRGLRELPIQADYLGAAIETTPDDHVSVRLTELDGEDVVLRRRNKPKAQP